MITKIGNDWKWYIVNCKEEQLRYKLKQIAENGGNILGWNKCSDLQAIMTNEGNIDIRVEVIYDAMQDQITQIYLKCGIVID